MINLTILKSNDAITTIQAKGHSGYAVAGQDIVCSAVSTIMQTTLNGLLEVVKADVDYQIDEQIPFLRISVNEQDRQAQILMQSAYLALKQIADDYKNYIKIKE